MYVTVEHRQDRQIKTRLAQRAAAEKLVASAEAKIDRRRQETQRAAKEAAREAMVDAKARATAIDAEREADARRNAEEYAAAEKLMLKADADRANIQANIKAEQGAQSKARLCSESAPYGCTAFHSVSLG